MSNSLQSHCLQDTRLPCPSLSPGVCSNSCPLSWWLSNHLSSATAFSFCLQSFPASGSFPMSQLFTSGGQITGALASVLSMYIQGWFPLGLTGLISLLSKGLSRVFSSTTVQKHQFFGAQPFLLSRTSLVAQIVTRLSTMWETRVQALGWEDPLEKEMAIHSSTIAWKIPRTEEPARLQSMGSQRVGHN